MKRKRCDNRRDTIIQCIDLSFSYLIAKYDHHYFEGKLDITIECEEVTALTTLCENSLVMGLYSAAINIWDLLTHSIVKTLKGHWYSITCVAILNNNCIVSGSTNSSVKIWNLHNNTVQTIMSIYSITALAVFNEDIFIGTCGGIMYIYNNVTQNKITIKAHDNQITCIVPFNNKIYTTIKIWNGLTEEHIITMTYPIRYIQLSNHKRIIAYDDTLIINNECIDGYKSIILSDNRVLIADKVSLKINDRIISKNDTANHFLQLPDAKILIVYIDRLEVWK